MTVEVLYVALMLAVGVALCGVGWLNSPKARARVGGRRLFVAIVVTHLPLVMFGAWVSTEFTGSLWIDALIVAALIAAELALIHFTRAFQTLDQAYGPGASMLPADIDKAQP
ncbi:MAG: hypothetical protein KA105_06200 [Caulobacter sp.]|nr:hypothetical protein [Caulobacter sp.]